MTHSTDPATGSPAAMPEDAAGHELMKARWKQCLGQAELVWGKLTHDELLQLEGHGDKLTGLVQERYALTRDAAVQQVKHFYAKYLS